MDSTQDLPPLALDQPLPAELTGRPHGWFTRYRTYPVFSAPWVRGRARSVGAAITGVLAFALLGLAVSLPTESLLGALAQLLLVVLVPLIVGPWLGRLVRRPALGAGRRVARARGRHRTRHVERGRFQRMGR